MKGNTIHSRNIFIIGMLFLLAGLICNEWTLASFFSADGTIALSRKIIIRLFNLVMIATGTLLIFKRNSLNIKQFLYFFYTVVFIVIVIETGLHITDYVIHRNDRNDISDKRYMLPTFKDKEMTEALFKEFDTMTGEYKEYRGWGKKEYHGKYLNIDTEGVRKSWNPDTAQKQVAKTIYVFGASRTWGDTARDDFTIPSFISKELHKDGYNFRVYNYAEWSYTYTQSLVYLIMLLRDGHRPDYIFFTEGTDGYTAYQSGIPGTLNYTYLFREKGEEITDIQHIWIGISNILKKFSMIYKQIIKINNKLDPPDTQFKEVAHTFNDQELLQLSNGVVEYLSNSLSLLDNLSKIYGFKYLCFTLPVNYTEDKLLDEEINNMDMRYHDRSLRTLSIYLNDSLITGAFPHFYNISDAFKDREKAYYVDSGHVTEDANEVIAQNIVSILKKEYLVK